MTARHTRVKKSLDQNIRTWTNELTREPAELVLGDLHFRLHLGTIRFFTKSIMPAFFCFFSRLDRIFLHYLNENDTSIIVHGNHHEQWLPQQICKFWDLRIKTCYLSLPDHPCSRNVFFIDFHRSGSNKCDDIHPNPINAALLSTIYNRKPIELLYRKKIFVGT